MSPDLRVGGDPGVSGRDADKTAASRRSPKPRGASRRDLNWDQTVLNDIAASTAAPDEAAFAARDGAARAAVCAARAARRGLALVRWRRVSRCVDAASRPGVPLFRCVRCASPTSGSSAGKPKLARWRTSPGGAAVGARRRRCRLSGAAARLH